MESGKTLAAGMGVIPAASALRFTKSTACSMARSKVTAELYCRERGLDAAGGRQNRLEDDHASVAKIFHRGLDHSVF